MKRKTEALAALMSIALVAMAFLPTIGALELSSKEMKTNLNSEAYDQLTLNALLQEDEGTQDWISVLLSQLLVKLMGGTETADEAIAAFAAKLQAGAAIAAENLAVEWQQRAYDDAVSWSNEMVAQILVLAQDPGLAGIMGTQFGENLVSFANGVPETVFGTVKDPIQVSTYDTLISTLTGITGVAASMFSIEFIGSLFDSAQQFPWVFARLPLTLQPLYSTLFAGFPVLIESILPIFVASAMTVPIDLLSEEGVSIDEGMIASVLTTTGNGVMDLLTLGRGTTFHVMHGSLYVIGSFIKLLFSAPWLAAAMIASLALTVPVLLVDGTLVFASYLPMLLASTGLSVVIGLLMIPALIIAAGVDLIGLVLDAVQMTLLTMQKGVSTMGEMGKSAAEVAQEKIGTISDLDIGELTEALEALEALEESIEEAEEVEGASEIQGGE